MTKLPPKFEQTLNQLQAGILELTQKYEYRLLFEGLVSCRKGCDHCCYYPVLVSLPEAMLILRAVRAKGMWTSELRTRVKEAADKVQGLSLDVWLLSKIPCVFLKDSECSIYGSRPFSCRTTFSKLPKKYCKPANFRVNTPNLLPRKQVLSELVFLETSLLAKHRLGRVVLPLPLALIHAEGLLNGETDFAQASMQVWKDYVLQW